MKLIITIEMDNAAFADDPQGEPARILEHLAEVILQGSFPIGYKGTLMMLRDVNGNLVGKAQVKP